MKTPIPSENPLIERFTPRDEIERESRGTGDLWSRDEDLREVGSFNVMQEMAHAYAREEHYAEAVKEAAREIADEDPRELIFRILEWTVEDLNNLAATVRRMLQSNRNEAKRLSRELGFRRNKAVRFFQRLFRLDQPVFGAGESGYLDIPTVRSMIGGEYCRFDADRVRARLRERIFGEKVVEILEPGMNDHAAAVGTDASVGEVRIGHRKGSFIPPTPASLFVAGAAMRVRDETGFVPYWDYDVDPRELSEYEDVEAAVRGLLITPKLRDEVITDFRHLKAAAMELRQYGEEARVLERRATWRPVGSVPELNLPPGISLLIRDGRIFPLVHRLEDYDGASAPDDVLYAEIVRREIETFRRVFFATSGLRAPVYAGAVKSPEFSWLSMTVFWYLERNEYIRTEGIFYRPPLNDQAVVHLLLWGLAERTGSEFFEGRRFARTFGILRRFSDIALQRHPVVLQANRVANENSEEDWWKFIEEHVRDGERRYNSFRRGVPPLQTEEYGPFVFLCVKCGVVMFYGAPTLFYRRTVESRNHFFTPRWEVAVECAENVDEIFSEKQRRLLKWLSDPGCMAADDFHPASDFEVPVRGLPLFVPDVVLEAHRVVSYTQGRHVPELTERLHQLIVALERSRT